MLTDVAAQVKRSVDIVDVVSGYVTLTPAGPGRFKACCPFHEEKTPSFQVNQGTGGYKCFGCGAGGDSFAFLQAIEGMTFPEALATLAQRCGIAMPTRGAGSAKAAAFDPARDLLGFDEARAAIMKAGSVVVFMSAEELKERCKRGHLNTVATLCGLVTHAQLQALHRLGCEVRVYAPSDMEVEHVLPHIPEGMSVSISYPSDSVTYSIASALPVTRARMVELQALLAGSAPQWEEFVRECAKLVSTKAPWARYCEAEWVAGEVAHLLPPGMTRQQLAAAICPEFC